MGIYLNGVVPRIMGRELLYPELASLLTAAMPIANTCLMDSF